MDKSKKINKYYSREGNFYFKYKNLSKLNIFYLFIYEVVFLCIYNNIWFL